MTLLCCYVADYSNKWRGPRWRDGPHKKILELGQVLEILIIYQLHPRCIGTIVGFCWLISAQKSLRIISNPIQRPILKATVFDVSWFLGPTRQWTGPRCLDWDRNNPWMGFGRVMKFQHTWKTIPLTVAVMVRNNQLYVSKSPHVWKAHVYPQKWQFLSFQGPYLYWFLRNNRSSPFTRIAHQGGLTKQALLTS